MILSFDKIYVTYMSLTKRYFQILVSLLAVIAAIFIGYTLFYNLGNAPLENWDEAWYAASTREMIATQSFAVMHWNQAVWLDKPPMYMWFTGFFSLFFGITEFSARLTSALSGLIILAIITRYSYKNYGIVPALFTCGTLMVNNLFVWRARSGNIDLLLSLEILITYLLMISKHRYKYPLLGLTLAFIYLTKASVVILPLLLFIASEFLYERKRLAHNAFEYVKLFVIFIGISSIWLISGYLSVGKDFIIYYLLKADQGQAGVVGFSSRYFYHIYYSLNRRFTWVLLLGIIFALKKIKSKEYFLLIFFACLLPIQLSFSARDNNWYLLPAFPFISILIGYGVYQILQFFKNTMIQIAVSTVITAAALFLFYRAYTINIFPIINSSGPVLQAESSKKIQTFTKKDDVIVRLDHLYPTTIYYSDRKVLASPIDNNKDDSHWISRTTLERRLQERSITWLIGTNKDIDEITKQFPTLNFSVIPVNAEESILRVTNDI